MKWRVAIIVLLILTPILFLMGMGIYHLWDRGWSFVAWWPMAGCFLTAYLLGWYWTRNRVPDLNMNPGDTEFPAYWTDRDREAWKIVEDTTKTLPAITSEEMGNITRYAKDAQMLAERVAQVYRPGTADPFGALTIPEILACAELIAQDLAQRVDKYVPGSQTLTLNNFRQVKKAAEWYDRGRNAYWIATAVADPLKAGVQYAANRFGLQSTLRQVKKNILNWLYTTYIRELGRHLIELNSGRLKVGAKRYRELIDQHKIPAESPIPDDDLTSEPEGVRLSVAVVGPVKSGKSSLINAIFGEVRTAVDSIPVIAGVTKYQLNEPDHPPLSITDTTGFGVEGAKDSDLAAAVEAASDADIVLFVFPARSAARKTDLEFLERLEQAFVRTPNLRLPPIVGVMSHVDLLTPAMEWNPPYDWENGTKPKELAIAAAMEAARETFTTHLAVIVPVCTSAGKEWGVRDRLLSTMAGVMPEARGVSLLRSLHAEANADVVKKAFSQAVNAGKEILGAIWKNRGESR